MENSIIRRSLSYLLIFCLILIQMVPAAAKVQAEETPEDFNGYPPLLITEISPDSAGSDYYEFFEVYNNSNQPLLLNNYTFHYLYTDGSLADKAFPIPENTVIQPQQTLVFWYNNEGKTPAEFNTFFGSSIPEERIISFKDEFPGFSIRNRALAIKNKAGQTIVSASYLAGETDNTGKVVQYQYSKTNVEMDKLATIANPTPGTFEPIQVPATPVNMNEIPEDLVAPVIEHAPVKQVRLIQIL